MKTRRSSSDLNIHLLSIVIPAYKAEKFIINSIEEVIDVMDQPRYNYEIICVVDGVIDNTYFHAKKLVNRYPKRVRVVGYKNNLGKGHAVRFGMAHAKGDIVGFIDAGLEINPIGIALLLEHFRWYNADIIVGSKRHAASKVVYPWQRKILSYGYQILARLLFGLKVRDTQVGLKFFKREVLEKTLPRLLVKAFAFDIEMLSVANYLGFSRIYEAPVELKMQFGGVSTITSRGFLRFMSRMAWDTLAVFYRLRVLRYYDSRNRKNWITPNYLKLSDKSDS